MEVFCEVGCDVIDDSDSIDELDLAGYVTLGEHGFALPCFSSGPNPNTWHVAVCSVSGNHLGAVVRFEHFSPQEVRRVSTEKIRRVRVGEAWCDVFVWKGQHFVGTPDEIWKALSEYHADIALRAPLTLLDLAQAADAEDRPRLAKDAYKYVGDRFGRAKAQLWRRDNYLRPHAIQHLQQLFLEKKLGEGAGLVQQIELIELPKAFSIEVPADLFRELVRARCSDGFLRHLQSLADPFGMTVGLLARPINVGTATGRTSPVTSPKEPIASRGETYDGENILLVVLGKRAEEIARHIREPEWAPMWSPGPVPQWRLNTLSSSEGRLFERLQKGKGKFDIIYGGEELPRLDHYAVVVALVDDDALIEWSPTGPVGRPLAEITSQTGAIRLLAPALPRNQPARSMAEEAALTDRLREGFDALLDTSTTRSPFWVGHLRRALERRVADTLLGAAMLVATRGGLSNFLAEHRKSSRTPVLAFSVNAPYAERLTGQDTEGDSLERGIATEVSGSDRYRSNLAGSILFASDFNAKWIERRAEFVTRGITQVKNINPEFGVFAQQVVSDVIATLDGPRPSLIGRLSSSKELARALSFPKHLHTVGVKRAEQVQRLAVIAETPDIDMVQVASDQGCALVRYTDHETIREFVAPGSRDVVGLLPREVQLPNIRRLSQNRHFATRGIDPRDVVMLSKKEMDDLRKRGPATLLECLRRYRADIEANRETIYTLPRSDLSRAIATARGAVKGYLEGLDPSRALRRQPAKRPSDLRVAWSKPPSGNTRFVVADGVLPIRLIKLPRTEVPAQKLFIIDGDAAVPALLQSRVFGVWARATLSRSTSWTPRFSVGGTFETFPILPPFELQPSEGSTSLILHASDKRLYSRARKWLEVLYSEVPNYGEGGIFAILDSIARHPLRRELEMSILDVYGLPPDASDLDILRRLLMANTRS